MNHQPTPPVETPLASQVEVLERRLVAAEAKLARLLSFGNQLATCAYNLKQQERLSEHDKKCLDAAQRGWDEARRMP